MSIELRLSNVDPPATEPSRTIYRDIVNLPDPVKLGITIRYFNYDDVDLYFQITGSATGYTFGTVNLGLLASGANAYINLDELASRAKPSAGDLPNGEKEENITLILKAYTDSGYTTLKWTFERVVTVHWINSADAAFTVDELDNFDDGTVQGWAQEVITNTYGTPSSGVTTSYALSAPYSVSESMSLTVGGSTFDHWKTGLYKSFTTPNKSKVYAIIDLRQQSPYAPPVYPKNLQVLNGSIPLIFLGRPYDNATSVYLTTGKWVRIVVPLPSNITLTLHVISDVYVYIPGAGSAGYSLLLDDFKIISK